MWGERKPETADRHVLGSCTDIRHRYIRFHVRAQTYTILVYTGVYAGVFMCPATIKDNI